MPERGRPPRFAREPRPAYDGNDPPATHPAEDRVQIAGADVAEADVASGAGSQPGEQQPFQGEFATPSEIVPTNEGVTLYGGADDRANDGHTVHDRLNGWHEHPTLAAIREWIKNLPESRVAKDEAQEGGRSQVEDEE